MSEIGFAGRALEVWQWQLGLERQISIKGRGGGLLGCDQWVDWVAICGYVRV